MTDNIKKPCSQSGPVTTDIYSQERIFTGACKQKHLGIKGCKPPIKATTTPNGTRGKPLTGSYNDPGFALTRAFRKSHAAKHGKSRTKFIYPIENKVKVGCQSIVSSGNVGNIRNNLI